MQSIPLIFGVDVAMEELVVARHGAAGVRQLRNCVAAVNGWLRELPKDTIVAMESTGTYHRLLAGLAHAAGLRVYVLNARDVYFYAKALGTRGKTDRVDCSVIARYAAEHHDKLHQWTPASPEHMHIDQLLRRRAMVSAKREALRQGLRGLADLGAPLKQLDAAFQALLKAIDARVKAMIKADACLATAQRRLAQVTGFGPVGSALLAVLLIRIPFENADALVAYSGLDPRPHDSGRSQGRRKITKRGPAYLRRQWYLAGMSAASSKAAKPLYQALRAKGFASTEAIMILGRKLLRVAYAVWKTGEPFNPQRLLPPAGA